MYGHVCTLDEGNANVMRSAGHRMRGASEGKHRRCCWMRLFLSLFDFFVAVFKEVVIGTVMKGYTSLSKNKDS